MKFPKWHNELKNNFKRNYKMAEKDKEEAETNLYEGIPSVICSVPVRVQKVNKKKEFLFLLGKF